MNIGNDNAIMIMVDLLKEHNIKRIVISPGGTNIPFVKAVQNDPFFQCYSIVDERSAIYFAIGLYLQTGEIIAASCTSAQATRNYIPGLTEAYYKRVPILAITMEKHPRFIGQEYMQAPDQTSLPRDSVKKTFELPFVSNIHDEYACIRIVNEAIEEVSNDDFGPVQICIPKIDFPIKEMSPLIRTINRYLSFDNKITLKSKKIMIVIGEHRPFKKSEKEAINNFCECYDCVVYTNHLSNFSGRYSIHANLEFTVMDIETFVAKYAPDILITIGGQTGDYPLYLILSKPELSHLEHWRVAEDGKFVDTYDKLTKVFKCCVEDFFISATNDETCSHDFYNQYKELCASTSLNIEIPFSNAFAAQVLHDLIPQKSIIQFSILNSLRIWNLFSLDSSIECYSNVGAFGIDGGMSTLIGQSVATNELCFMIIGDLAFYYDMNALGIRHIGSNLRILLINNNGGVEFKLNYKDHKETDQYIAAANHFKNAYGWCETCGCMYISASNKNEFLNQYQKFIGVSDKPIVFELFINDRDDYDAYQKLLDNNRKIDMTEKIKKGIKRFIRK